MILVTAGILLVGNNIINTLLFAKKPKPDIHYKYITNYKDSLQVGTSATFCVLSASF